MSKNSVCFRVHGSKAMFSDPIANVGGEKMSYMVPTYAALKGIIDNIYWKPTITWVIDRVKVVNPISTLSVGTKKILYSPKKISDSVSADLSYFTYLRDVDYIVEAHLEWNMDRTDMIQDRNEKKHISIFNRSVKTGGRVPIVLGTTECAAFVEPCEDFDSVASSYDGCDVKLGVMYHSYEYYYPNNELKNCNSAARAIYLWNPVMENGVITFPRPENCPIKRTLILNKEKNS